MPEDFGQRLPYMMRMVSNELSRRLERALRPLSLTHAQLAALAQLGLESPGALTSSELGRRAGVTTQSMSTATAALLDRGLVVRAPDPTHGRRLDIQITTAGMELLERAQAATKQVEERALAPLTAEQQREFRTVLRQLMSAMDVYVPESDDRT
ncbi:MarR family winged helix-turn-helix transcriptional regulator [Nocardia sp. NPDC020380]|uniref:MarR family winged helix-turn-helix transcriptional regulator n=1 Tax=Nocardia sp. NPDC020380 TaxID=3364309 RepID=UPI00379D0959